MGKKKIQNAIKFYNQCFQLDNQEHTLWDLLAKKHDFSHVCDNDQYQEVLRTYTLGLNDEFAESIRSRIYYYRREKKFIAAYGVITGKLKNEQVFGKTKSKTICAPVLMFDAEVFKSNTYFIGVRWGNPQWNIPLIKKLLGDNFNPRKLNELLPPKENNKELDFDGVTAYLNENSEDYEIVQEETYANRDDLKSFKRSRSKSLKLSRSFSFLFVDRSRTTRGVIDELNTLEEGSRFSTSLHYLLGSGINYKTSIWGKKIEVPGILSLAQERIVKNSRKEILSMVIGPPGTGKSYTIASIALDHFLNSKAVLIVSKNEHAVSVIQEKLINKFGIASQAIMRAGENEHHKNLLRFVKDLNKYHLFEDNHRKPFPYHSSIHYRDLTLTEKDFYKQSKQAVYYGLEHHEKHIKRVNWLRQFKLWNYKRRLKSTDLSFEMMDELTRLNSEKDEYLAEYINKTYLYTLSWVIKTNRTSISNLKDALKARNSARQERMFEGVDFDVLLKAMPIWLCSLDNLHRALPLEKELFETVIFDEATQCDISSCIPAFQRAKKAVVVGDPKQLRHVSFLSRDMQEEIKKGINSNEDIGNLDYRDHSILDLVEEKILMPDKVTLLDEHYRSLPAIIEFSNKQFYNDKLKVMREKPKPHFKSPIKVIHCSGKRENGVNLVEADRVIQEIKTIIDEQKDLPDEHKLSIGVLSFFRDQAQYLQEQILETFNIHEVMGHKLRAGTPYAFQGEERNIMLISCCIDSQITSGVYTYLNKPNVFNVGVTRAKDLQILFLSIPPDEIANKHLIKQYLNHASSFYQKPPSHAGESRMGHIKDVCEALSKKGITFYEGATIANNIIDILCTKGQFSFGIDLIGFPGDYIDVFTLERYKVLNRTGLQIVPLTLHEWIYKRNEFLDYLDRLLLKNADEINTIKPTAENLQGHWFKVLEVNPKLAKKIRSIEVELFRLDEQSCIDQIGEMLKNYVIFLDSISGKLNPDEITYARYKTAVDHLLLKFIDNMGMIVNLWDGIGQSGDPEDAATRSFTTTLVVKQMKKIDEIKALNEQAIDEVQRTAVEWSRVDTVGQKQKFNQMLSELEELNKMIRKYDKK